MGQEQSRRLILQTILSNIPGVAKTYFQPPSNVDMEYPCIVYERDSGQTDFANNSPYRHTKRYQVTVIDENPDSEIPSKVAALPLCLFVRHFSEDDLHHDIYNIYF